MSELKALIFDVDGTLAETEEFHRKAYNETFSEADLSWHWTKQDYADLLHINGGKERLSGYIQLSQPEYAEHPELQNKIDLWYQRKNHFYQSFLQHPGITLRPGIKRLLNTARHQGIRLAIASSSAEKNIKTLLKTQLGEDAVSWFEVIGAGHCVKHKKPETEIYEYVLDKLGLAASQCMAMEDSIEGLQAATGVHLATLITTHFYTEHQDFKQAVAVADNLGEPGSPAKVSMSFGQAVEQTLCITLTDLQAWHAQFLLRQKE